jgi:hypothetical protein
VERIETSQGDFTTSRRLNIDVAAIRRSTDILRYIPNAAGLKKIAGTGGGELAGPCYRCGGIDRFHCQPNYPGGGRWFCSHCTERGKWQDVITLVMWLEGICFKEAARRLQIGSMVVRRPPVSINAAPASGPKPYRAPFLPHRVISIYDYQDTSGRLVYQKLRIEPGFKGRKKDFWHRRPRPGLLTPSNSREADWIFGRGRVEPPLIYKLPAVSAASAGLIDGSAARVFVLDGEMDVDLASADGLIATCAPDGWASWPAFYDGLFIGLHVVIVPDQEPGAAEQARRIAQGIYRYAESVRVLARLPEAAQ